VFARVKYTVNVANLVALVIQIIKWTISFVPILLSNKNYKFPIFRKYFGNISKILNFGNFPNTTP